MTINSLKDLEGLVKLMRKQGIQTIKVDGMELTLGQEPIKASKTAKDSQQATLAPGGITEDVRIPTDFPSMEELLNWSVTSEGQ